MAKARQTGPQGGSEQRKHQRHREAHRPGRPNQQGTEQFDAFRIFGQQPSDPGAD